MIRAGLKLLLLIELAFSVQRAIATNSPEGNADATPQNSSTLVTNVAQLRSLSRADFNRGRAVSLTGTVTLVDGDRQRLVLQDATGAVMWYSDHQIDPALAGRAIRIVCPQAWPYAVAFPDFPERPSGADLQTDFEAPSNWGDYHLTRMAGYLRPPQSGDYIFSIASDDSSELWLSTDEDPTRVRKIAFVTEGFWTSPRDWDRFPSQRSEPIHLRADKSYYIEAFAEQGQQDEHLSVAWEGPGIVRSVIPGVYLAPWAGKTRETSVGGHGGGLTRRARPGRRAQRSRRQRTASPVRPLDARSRSDRRG